MHTIDHYGHFGPAQVHVPNPHLWDHEIRNFGKGLPTPFKYSFSFHLVLITLQKMLLNCFTHKHFIPSMISLWNQTLYPGDHDVYNFGRGIYISRVN